ncbi:MAG: ABC transporter ATP-binding protein [Xanthomonadales bacterium]|nr:ABC transporter ATP-binding protein [Xanthomonadales bacterium]
MTFTKSLPGVRRLLGFLWPYVRQHKSLLAGSFLALFAGVAMRALEPWPLKFVIDYLVIPVSGIDHSSLPGSPSALQLLLLAGAALVVVYGLRGLSTYYQKVGFALVGIKVLTEVRGALYRHIQCLSMAFHSKARSGDLIFRVISDIGLLRDIAVTAFMPLIGSVLVLATMAGLMLWINWKLALVVLVSAPLFWLPTLFLSRRIQKVSRVQRKRESAMASMASESITAVQAVQSLALDSDFADRFSGQNKKSLKEGVKVRRLLARLQATVLLMTGVSTAAVLFYGTLLVLRGALTAGELLVFLSYLKAVFKPLQDFAKYTGRMAKASAAGERVIQIFETPQDIEDLPHATDAPPFRGDIAFEDVHFGYEEGAPVLAGLNLEIKAGEFVALVGESGAGKSTVVEMLSRLHDPQRGKVLIDGNDLRDYTLVSLRTQISVVMQDTLLFATTIAENIRYGRADASDEELVEAAKLAGAHAFISELPGGYASMVGERGVTLSVGQKQRIAIARAVLGARPILVLDEPTTGLDPETRRALVNTLADVARRQTTLMITHDMEEAAVADRICRLQGGRAQTSPLDPGAEPLAG